MMKIKCNRLVKLISLVMPVFLLFGCAGNANVTTVKKEDVQLATFRGEGASYQDKYYFCYSDDVYSFRAFDESTKKIEYLCKKDGCKHLTDDETCISYSLDAMGFIPVGEYLYVFVHEYESLEPGQIDRINLKTGEREKYLDSSDFGLIYNAYLLDEKIYFSDHSFDGVASVKMFDIEKKTIEAIANKDGDNNVYAYINAIEDNIIYYREGYRYTEYEKRKAIHRPKDTQRFGESYIDDIGMVPIAKWYYHFIDDTALFTYDLKTKVINKTADGVEDFGWTYYDKNSYYTNSENELHRIEWLTGKDELLLSNDNQIIKSDEVLGNYINAFDGKLFFSRHIKKPREGRKNSFYEFVTGLAIYDIKSKVLSELNFDDNELQHIFPIHELKDGFIIGYTTKSKAQTTYGYILNQDYYTGKTEFISF